MAKNPHASAGDTGDTDWISGWKDPLEEEMAIHSSILTRKNPWLQSIGHCWAHTQHLIKYRVCYVLSCSCPTCPTLCNPMDCSPPGSSVHGILQARILEWGCHALLQGIFPTQGSNQVSCIAGGFFTIWARQVQIFCPQKLHMSSIKLFLLNTYVILSGIFTFSSYFSS